MWSRRRCSAASPAAARPGRRVPRRGPPPPAGSSWGQGRNNSAMWDWSCAHCSNSNRIGKIRFESSLNLFKSTFRIGFCSSSNLTGFLSRYYSFKACCMLQQFTLTAGPIVFNHMTNRNHCEKYRRKFTFVVTFMYEKYRKFTNFHSCSSIIPIR